jgi:hypothetical protein
VSIDLLWLLAPLFAFFALVAIGSYLTRESVDRWVRTERVPVLPTADRIEPAFDYRSAPVADDFVIHVEAVAPPAAAVRAASLLGRSVWMVFLTALPVLGGLLAEAEEGELGPVALFGGTALILGAMQLRARNALVRIRLQRASFVRVVAWLTMGYAAMGWGAIALASARMLPHAWLQLGLHGMGIVLAPLLGYPMLVGYGTLRGAAAMRDAKEPKLRIDAASPAPPAHAGEAKPRLDASVPAP